MVLCSFLSWKTSERSQVLLRWMPTGQLRILEQLFFSLREFHIQAATHTELANCPEFSVATQQKIPIT